MRQNQYKLKNKSNNQNNYRINLGIQNKAKTKHTQNQTNDRVNCRITQNNLLINNTTRIIKDISTQKQTKNRNNKKNRTQQTFIKKAQQMRTNND